MKNRRNFLAALIVFILIVILLFTGISYVFSQEESSEEGIVIYDPDNPDSYWESEFYQYTSPTFWRWEYVNWQIESVYEYIDWGLVNYNEPVIYQFPEFFGNLPDDKYTEIRYDLIEDYSLINYAKIDGTKYANDFGCGGCRFDVGIERNLLIYSNDGFIFHSSSTDNIYIGDYPDGTRFVVISDGIIVLCSQESNELCASERGSFSIQTENRELMYYNGNSINGIISFREGQTYLKEGGEGEESSLVTINNIDIVDEGTPGGVNIYFDGEEHQGDYISLGNDNIIIESDSGKTSYTFSTGNDFFEIPPGDDGDIYENALIFFTGIGSKIEIEDRSNTGLIPEVTVYRNKPIEIRNGANVFTFSRESDTLESLEEGGESTSFTLIYLDENGENVLRGDNPKTIFDRNNHFIVIRTSDIPESELECYDCALNLVENDFLYDYYTAQIFGNSDIKIDDHVGNPITLSNIAYYLSRLTPDLVDSINVIQILSDEEIIQECGENADACVNMQTQTMSVRESITFHTFNHESAHTLTSEYQKRVEAMEGELLAYELFLVKKYGAESFSDFTDIYWNRATDEERNRFLELSDAYWYEDVHNSLQSRWLENAGGEDFYRRVREVLGEPTVAEMLSTYWAGEDPETPEAIEPRYGCFTPYACNNFKEDVAETVERFTDMEYGLIMDYINPNSKWYQLRIGREIGHTGNILTREEAERWARSARGRVEFACNDLHAVSERECSMVLGE